MREILRDNSIRIKKSKKEPAISCQRLETRNIRAPVLISYEEPVREKMRIVAEKRFQMQELEACVTLIPKVSFEGQLQINYVTLLNEIFLDENLSLPSYETEQMEVLFLPSKFFIGTCATQNYHELGCGTERKIALRMAAYRMFQSVKNRLLDERLSVR